MNKTLRIKVNPGEEVNKYVKVKLDQDIDTLEILSFKIGQTDIYSSFNADYGVLIGRVIGNNSIGIPNAKISVFIPITEDDKLRSEILAIYPYETVRDQDQEGRKYNLLPRVSVNNPFISAGEYSPVVPIGSFPTKEEIYSNPAYLEVYKKYYKYTTVTNNNGDYMIYGVPIGTHDVHMSIDITDIGKYSMTPGTMINQLGYSPNLFANNGTKIRFSTDLETLPNVELQTASVNVRPFWGDRENFEIGITRQDFKIRTILASSFVVFGSAFTDAFRATWGQNDHLSGDDNDEMWRINTDGNPNVSVSSKRIGKIVIDVFYYPNRVSDEDIANGNIDTKNDIVLLDPSEYTSYIEDGQFILILPCNRRKVIQDETGNEIVVSDNNTNGVFTEFKGMFLCRYGDELPTPEYDDIAGGLFDNHTYKGQRWRFKIPQSAPENQPINSTQTGINEIWNENWRKEHYTFDAGKIYSVSKFQHLDYRDQGGPGSRQLNLKNGADPFWNTGVLVTDNAFSSDNSETQFPSNGTTDGNRTIFGAEWLNFCLHFPQHTYFIRNSTSDLHSNQGVCFNADNNRHFYTDNTQLVVANFVNTKNILRNDYHQTTFVEVPREDIVFIINNVTSKGFKTSDLPPSSLIGNYPSTESVRYFYKGFASSDCIQFLVRNGIINL